MGAFHVPRGQRDHRSHAASGVGAVSEVRRESVVHQEMSARPRSVGDTRDLAGARVRTLTVSRHQPALVSIIPVVVAALVLAAPFHGRARSLFSLRRVDDHPLYVMHLYGNYDLDEYLEDGVRSRGGSSSTAQMAREPWACTVFAALNQEGEALLGRSFDWYNRPTLVLFTHPPGDYASVSLVDLSYLGFDTEPPTWRERLRLLDAPYWTFDGMNEMGVAVGMMAVPWADTLDDPGKLTIGSLDAIRLVLDKAGSVDEAIALLGAYNIDWEGGPPLHYLIADAAGHSAVVEFVQGRMQVLPNREPWQVATNFLLTGHTAEGAQRSCPRYATAYKALERADGSLSPVEAMDLLEDVSQDITMWSVVYGMTGGEIRVSVGRDFGEIHQFGLPMGDS
jgi:hypothetical protein